MSRQIFLLALTALAIIMLVGCQQPVGMPNHDVQAATTVYCEVNDDEMWSGHVDLYSGFMTIDSCVDSFSPVVRRGYNEYQNRPYPRQIGFCYFEGPAFSSLSPTCTLFYYQKDHYGLPELEVRWASYPLSGAPAETLFWYSWGSDTVVAYDSTHSSNAWYKVPFTLDGCAIVGQIATGGGGTLITGWVYPGSTDGVYTEVYGATSDYAPYIKVVY